MNLIPLPAFQDDSLWLLHDGQQARVADPGDAQPVLAHLQSTGSQLAAILVTHHRPDPIGGVDPLRAATGAPVYGPAHERTLADVEFAKAADPGNDAPADGVAVSAAVRQRKNESR